MAENPYAPPRLSDSEVKTSTPRHRRPIGVMLVALLILLPGAAVFCALALSAAFEGNRGLQELSRREGLLIYLAVVFPLGIVSAIGIWLGGKWAWYGAQLYCAFNCYAGLRGWIAYGHSPNVGQSIFLALHLLAVLYLHCPRERAYFGLSLRRSVLSTIAIAIAAATIYHALTWVPVLVPRLLSRG